MTLQYLFRGFILFAVYLITAKLGLDLYAVHDFATLIWMPTGIALSALLLYGKKLAPAITLAAFLVNYLTGAPPLVALGIALGNTLEALLGVYLLERYIQFNPRLERLRDALGFVAVAFCIPIVSATFGVTSLWLGGIISMGEYPLTFAAWWLGDLLGALIVTPFLVCWFSYSFSFQKTRTASIELVGVFASLIVTTIFVYWTDYGQIGSSPFSYVLFLPLIWAALRTGSQGVTLALLVLSVIANTAAVTSMGPFSPLDPQQALFELQFFIAFVVLIFLPFAAIVEHEKTVAQSLKNQNEDLEHALKKVAGEDQAKSDFLAILAHELRNPLAPIVSSLELAKLEAEEIKATEISKLIGSTSSHVRTMTQLLDDLLDISRISRNKLILKKETVELQSIIHHARLTVEPFFQSKKHTLLVSMPEETIWLFADSLRIEQMVVNVLNNAGKYTQEGGIIDLRVEVLQHMFVRITLSDNGIGIERSMLKQIFQPFVQLESKGETKVGTGLGIGLSLTKRLVELHGGKIQAQSGGLGKGSAFIIELPLYKASAAEKREQSAHLAFPDSVKVSVPSQRILIVDDNETAAFPLRELLVHKGHHVSVVHNGRAALEYVEKIEPHVVLLDIGMPDMDGFMVARELRAKYGSDLILVALTGFGQDDDKRKAKAAGFDHHLTKPVLLAEIEHVLLRNI